MGSSVPCEGLGIRHAALHSRPCMRPFASKGKSMPTRQFSKQQDSSMKAGSTCTGQVDVDHKALRPTRRESILYGVGSLTAVTLGGNLPPASADARSGGPGPVGITPKESKQLGKSGLQVSSVSLGAWSWGDRSGYWGYGKDYSSEDNLQAYKALIESGISCVDTAEVYGFGLSEELLGQFMKETGTQPVIATKFAPLPWKVASAAVLVVSAHHDKDSKLVDKRGMNGAILLQGELGAPASVTAWPLSGFLTQAWSNDAFVSGLAKCAQQGLTQAVGVSNFNASRVKRAAEILTAEGVPLASNQVQYSLLYRTPESNGVAEAVKEAGATLVAYSPLSQGLLTGKYTEDNLPSGPRSGVINADRVREVQPLLGLMREIAGPKGKTLAQVGINWTICKGALPIPGAKNAKQVREAAGAFGWRLSDEEMRALDKESGKLKPGLANPVENF